MQFVESLQVFFGEANPARARVYVRCPRPEEGGAWRLSGRVAGPQNALAATLPVTVTLRDLGPGPTVLAEAVLPDPCFWSAASPAIYQVEATLHNARGEAISTLVQPLGIRAVGTRGRSFSWEGKRWVWRGVDRRLAATASVSTWRELWAAPLADDPDEEFCRQASTLGVPLAVGLTGEARDLASQIRRLARWPAVTFALVAGAAPFDEQMKAAAPNVLWGQLRAAGDPPDLAPWADFAFAEVERPEGFARRWASAPCPVVAFRRLADAKNLAAARTACDDLQRDLAPFGDYAGYVVVGSDAFGPGAA